MTDPTVVTPNVISSAVAHLRRAERLEVFQGPTGDKDDAMHLFAVPANTTLQQIDTETLMPSPRRIKATAVADDLDSFIGYLNRFADADRSVIWAQLNPATQALQLLGVLDEHAHDLPSWRTHRVTYKPPLSVEWARWTSMNGKAMTQVEFATWIEDNISDIPSVEGLPSGSEMLAMALAFEARQDMRIKSHIRLQGGGVNLEFVGDDDAATVEKMKYFDRFAIGVPVFWGGDAYRVEARLRYRANSPKPSFWYDLQRPDRTHEAAARDVLNKLRATLPDIPLLLGQLA